MKINILSICLALSIHTHAQELNFSLLMERNELVNIYLKENAEIVKSSGSYNYGVNIGYKFYVGSFFTGISTGLIYRDFGLKSQELNARIPYFMIPLNVTLNVNLFSRRFYVYGLGGVEVGKANLSNYHYYSANSPHNDKLNMFLHKNDLVVLNLGLGAGRRFKNFYLESLLIALNAQVDKFDVYYGKTVGSVSAGIKLGFYFSKHSDEDYYEK